MEIHKKNGPHIPTKKVDDKELPKLESIWSNDDYKKEVIHSKTMNAIMCIITPNEFKISKCMSTKAMWEKLVITYEGTSQVKES